MNARLTKAHATKTPKLKPDFSHRLSVLGDEATPCQLAEAIDTLALQAENVLALIGSQFTTKEEESGRMADEVIYWSISSVMATVKDMAAIVGAYHQAKQTTRQ